MSKPTGRARELGAVLRQRREAAGFSELKLSRTLGMSHGQVCRIEQGIRSVSTENVARCLTLYGVFGEEHDEIMALAKEVNDEYRLKPHNDKLPEELRTLIHCETTATSIDAFDPSLIPGMLQTENYARALFHYTGLIPEDGIELRVRTRMDRQKLLQRDDCPQMRFFIHECALHPSTISDQIMGEQALALVLATTMQSCEIRIIPASAGPVGVFGGSFRFMRYTDYIPTVYVENASTSTFLEGASDLRIYRGIVNKLASVALSAEESRQEVASLAP